MLPVAEPDSLARHEPCFSCPQHRTHGAGCAVVEAGADVTLDQFLAREPCFLKEELRSFAARFLSHRPRSLADPDDLVQEVSARLLADPQLRQGGFGRGLRPFLGYLRRTLVRVAVTAERSERGRMRCGNCRHYGPWSGRCLNLAHEHARAELPATQEPRHLDPPCRAFVLRRAGRALTPLEEENAAAPETPAPDSEILARIHRALVELAEIHPRAALVVRARLVEQRTYDDLSEVAASVRTMKRDFAFGLAFLKRRLKSLAPESLAPERKNVRSERAWQRPS